MKLNDSTIEMLKAANIELGTYRMLAGQVGQMICDQFKQEKGWKCEYQLGDFEDGVDLIKITITDESKNPTCCYDSLLDLEQELAEQFKEFRLVILHHILPVKNVKRKKGRDIP
jgi:hypothetical protein